MQTEAKQQNKTTEMYKGILILLFGIITIFLFYSIRDKIEKYKTLGYIGAFIISLVSSGTLILPAPGWSVIGLSFSLNPFLLGLVAGLGSALGELTGYFTGLGSNYILDDRFKRLHDIMEKYGKETLFVLALIPNPFFDIAGILAGASRMKLHEFLIPVALGKIIRFIILCYMTVYGMHLFNSFF